MGNYWIMQRTRLEDTRIWLHSCLDDCRTEKLDKRIASITAGGDDRDMAIAAIIDGTAGKLETYQELIDYIATETEDTFSFESFHKYVKALSERAYTRPTKAQGTRTGNLYVQIGRANAYEWLRSHLRNRIEMTIPGEMFLRFDVKPRHRKWKVDGAKFAHCASQKRVGRHSHLRLVK